MDTRPIGFWLKLVDRLIDEQFAATLDEHGVTRRQWQLLNVLARENATVEQLDAAVAPFLSAATDDSPAESSAEHLTELIDSAWVAATADGYELTERGRTAFEKLEEVVAQQRTLMAEGVSPDEYQQTVGVLERMARNLGYED
ncbi:MAG: transcriptional regulator [Rhodoglobus sp.]|nr:transcriptional regulator [Rhodoglobus sp.]